MTKRPDSGRVYGLSYRPKAVDRSPELLITIAHEDFHHALCKYLSMKREKILESGKRYLERESAFVEFVNDHFGFDGCGYMTQQDGMIAYHIPFSQGTVDTTMITLAVLFEHLNLVYWDAQDAGKAPAQLIEIRMRADAQVIALGHYVGGTLEAPFVSWLRMRGESDRGEELPEVTAALKEVWETIANLRAKCSRYCNAQIFNSGRFVLESGTDRCGLYLADEIGSRTEEMPLSSGNVDSAVQALTLVAGFAALYELAVADIG